MGKGKNQKKEKNKRSSSVDSVNTSLHDSKKFEIFGKYNSCFEEVTENTRIILKDSTSAAGASVPVRISEISYLAEPDGKLIRDSVQNQRKCDYLLYVPSAEQTNFIELKGMNISDKSDKSPHNQICQTIEYFLDDTDLKKLIISKEKQAFIVSPGQQRIPQGIETEERALFRKLAANTRKKYQMDDLIHYVKVVPKGKYSCKKKQIICTNTEGVPIPYKID